MKFALERYHRSKNENCYNFKTAGETNPAFIGFELEVQRKEKYEHFTDNDYDYGYNGWNIMVPKKLYDKYSELYFFEQDPTLLDDEGYPGFEIISQPLSEKYFNENKSMFQDTIKILQKYGYCKYIPDCDFHVHIDKNFFEKRKLSSYAKLIYIFKKYITNFEKFARQKRNLYAHDFDNNEVLYIVKDATQESWCRYDRYTYINLANKNTVEIRLWSGIQNYETLLATMKFSYRLMHLCKEKTSKEISTMSFEDILGDDPDILEYWNTVKDIVL